MFPDAWFPIFLLIIFGEVYEIKFRGIDPVEYSSRNVLSSPTNNIYGLITRHGIKFCMM